MTKKAADTIESSSATTTTNNTIPSTLAPSSLPSTARRSFRIYKRDPIVAPGFGTQSDLTKLARDLDLSVEAVHAIMSSQGRGITRRSRREKENSTTDPQLNSAWADFLSSEQPPASETPTATVSVDTKLSTEQRNYRFPWTNLSDARPSKKSKVKAESGGVLVQAGTLDATCIGRTRVSSTDSRIFDLSVPSILLPRLSIRRVIASCSSAHALAIDTNGTVYGWGRNEASQLGGGLPANVARPFALEGLSSANTSIDGAVGKYHSIVLTKSRELFAVGSNKSGQCGLPQSLETIAQFRKCNGATNIVQISCGEAFSVALDEHGFLYTTGSSEYGQLGNGSTGERFITANKASFDNSYSFQKRTEFTHIPGEKSYGAANSSDKVVDLKEDIRLCHIACGKYHTIAVEAPSEHHPPRVFSWGCGNYGCLGHGIQADEYKPRSIAAMIVGNQWFANPSVSGAAGTSCSMVLTGTGQVYYWGKHRTIGEAIMRPQVLSELANNQFVAELVAAGNQTVVIATNNAVTVAWGNGHHGELGYGSKKSSSKPDFVASLNRCRIQDLACGYGTTYYVVKKEDKSDEDAIKGLPVVSDEAFLELERYLDTTTGGKKK